MFFFFHFCHAASARVVFQSVGTAELLQAGYYRHGGNEAQLQLISTRRRGKKKKKRILSFRPDCHASWRLSSSASCLPFNRERLSPRRSSQRPLFLHVQPTAVILQRLSEVGRRTMLLWDLGMNHPTAAAGAAAGGSDRLQLRRCLHPRRGLTGGE